MQVVYVRTDDCRICTVLPLPWLPMSVHSFVNVDRPVTQTRESVFHQDRVDKSLSSASRSAGYAQKQYNSMLKHTRVRLTTPLTRRKRADIPTEAAEYFPTVTAIDALTAPSVKSGRGKERNHSYRNCVIRGREI